MLKQVGYLFQLLLFFSSGILSVSLANDMRTLSTHSVFISLWLYIFGQTTPISFSPVPHDWGDICRGN